MHRRTLLALFAALALALLGCSRSGSTDLKSLTVDEVDARIAAHDGKTYVFDNNAKDHFATEHLPGARWVAYDNVTAADLPQDKGATLVFYCASEL